MGWAERANPRARRSRGPAGWKRRSWHQWSDDGPTLAERQAINRQILQMTDPALVRAGTHHPLDGKPR